MYGLAGWGGSGSSSSKNIFSKDVIKQQERFMSELHWTGLLCWALPPLKCPFHPLEDCSSLPPEKSNPITEPRRSSLGKDWEQTGVLLPIHHVSPRNSSQAIVTNGPKRYVFPGLIAP